MHATHDDYLLEDQNVPQSICTRLLGTYKQTDTLDWKCAVIFRTVFYISYEMRIKVK